MNTAENPKTAHWADQIAERIIREKGERNPYVCASGITPSGTVHIGNFREIISVELVVRALRDRGKQVRFLYSWDDYDTFRKVPDSMPHKEQLEQYLRQPITEVPDLQGTSTSYARHNEEALEQELARVGIEPEYIYQSQQYTQSRYAEGIKTALDNMQDIRKQLNAHRTTPLPANWWPVSIFCTRCKRDTTRVTRRPEPYTISYTCQSCNQDETLDLRTTGAVKLPWRIDWPMRWSHEKVDFEPAGKDHHSEGGSFDTARLTSQQVYGFEPPVSFQYDFVRIKGGTGKISSSRGTVVSLAEVLRYYQPEVTRFLFAGTRPNSEFAISFDLDLLKVYEDYDTVERSYFNKPDNPKKLAKWQKNVRIYELSQVAAPPKTLPWQIRIRHLTTLLQIHRGDIQAVMDYLGDIPPHDQPRFTIRARCAWNWITDYAPEDFRFSLNTPDQSASLANPQPQLQHQSEHQSQPKLHTAMTSFAHLVNEHLGTLPEKEFSTRMYDLIRSHNLESPEFFAAVYQVLIGKDKGPRLVNFLHILGKKTLMPLLAPYLPTT